MQPNVFEGKCDRCGKTVKPGEGWVTGRKRQWNLTHDSCIPKADTRAYRKMEYDL